MEIGQLAVLLVSVPLVGTLVRRIGIRRVRVYGSLVLAAFGAWWFLQRVWT